MTPPRDGRSTRLVVLGLCAAYFILIVTGYGVFRQEDTMVRGNELSKDRAFFTAINAATLSGFQLSIKDYLPPGQVMVLILTVGGSLFSLIAGGLAVVRIIGLEYSDRQVIVAALISEAIAILAGTALLLEPGRSLLEAAMQAASAFGNSGMYEGHLSGVGDWQTHIVLLPLAILGGLGIVVVMELFHVAFVRRSLSHHSLVVLAMTGGIYLFGLVLIHQLQRPELPPGTSAAERFEAWRAVVASSSAAVLNSRTAGFPFEFATEFPRTVQWALMVLMMIGASPGGTGGGLKTTTLAELARSAWRALRGQSVARPFGIAATWLGLYLLLILVALLFLLHHVPQMPADRIFFLTISAASNVGLSHDPVAIVGTPLYVLSFTMILGRLFPLAILWWMALTARDADWAIG